MTVVARPRMPKGFKSRSLQGEKLDEMGVHLPSCVLETTGFGNNNWQKKWQCFALLLFLYYKGERQSERKGGRWKKEGEMEKRGGDGKSKMNGVFILRTLM